MKHTLGQFFLDVYRDSKKGVGRAEFWIVNGQSLNDMLHTDEYDAHAAYVVKADGTIERETVTMK